MNVRTWNPPHLRATGYGRDYDEALSSACKRAAQFFGEGVDFAAKDIVGRVDSELVSGDVILWACDVEFVRVGR